MSHATDHVRFQSIVNVIANN